MRQSLFAVFFLSGCMIPARDQPDVAVVWSPPDASLDTGDPTNTPKDCGLLGQSFCTSSDAGTSPDQADVRIDLPDVVEPIYATADIPIRLAFAAGGVSYATARDGTFWAWGDNDGGDMQPAGRFLPATQDIRTRPQMIYGIRDVREFEWRGGAGTCALTGPESGGPIYCWGRGAYQMFGVFRGEVWDQWRYPRQLGTITDVLSLSQYQECVRADHFAWEFNLLDEEWRQGPSRANWDYGGRILRTVNPPGVAWVDEGLVRSLLDPDRSGLFPSTLQRIAGIVEVSGGLDHVCVRLESGRIMCWGGNAAGQSGSFEAGEQCGSLLPCKHHPTLVPNIDDAVRIACGSTRSCVIRRDRTVWCWGDNVRLTDGLGLLGDGQAPDELCVPDAIDEDGVRTPDPRYARLCRMRPVQVVGLTDVVELSVGSGHACAVTASGQLLCWGMNGTGALGDGTRRSRGTPAPVRWH